MLLIRIRLVGNGGRVRRHTLIVSPLDDRLTGCTHDCLNSIHSRPVKRLPLALETAKMLASKVNLSGQPA
jgi:hypothetical protein